MSEEQSSPLIDPGLVGSQAEGPVTAAPVDVTSVATKKKPTAEELGPKEYCWGVGRRKSSVARVRVRPGEGKISVNGKTLEDYFPKLDNQRGIIAPLKAAEKDKVYDVHVNVKGGGSTGQAGAACMGLARALVVADPASFQILRDRGFLTRDGRMVERKKYGQKGARKRFQFSKR